MWHQLGLRRFPVVGMLDRMWKLRHNVTAYDATYVALAEELDCPLLTADSRLRTPRDLAAPSPSSATEPPRRALRPEWRHDPSGSDSDVELAEQELHRAKSAR